MHELAMKMNKEALHSSFFAFLAIGTTKLTFLFDSASNFTSTASLTGFFFFFFLGVALCRGLVMKKGISRKNKDCSVLIMAVWFQFPLKNYDSSQNK